MGLLSLKRVFTVATSLFAASIMAGSAVHAAMTPEGYDLNTQDRTITISPTAADPANSFNAAMKYLANRQDKTTWWTVKMLGGKYNLSKTLLVDRVQYVNIKSERIAPAFLYKPATSTYEWMLNVRYSNNVTLSGFVFTGKTKTYDPGIETNLKHPNWSDQGVLFASTNKIAVDANRFHDFGNAALRIQTHDGDPVKGVNSFNSTVTNNFFKNVFQVTTTSNSYDHGGSANYLFQNNNAVDLHGSIKFASRTPGATNIWIRNNAIQSSTMDGFEISSYQNVEMSGNRIENVARHAVNCYTNTRVEMGGFNWGDNFTFKNNVINNTLGGLRFNPGAYSDGFVPVPRNVSISGNTFNNLRGPNPAVSIVGGTVQGLDIVKNKLTNIASKKYFSVASGSTQVNITGNLVDNKAYTIAFK